MAEVYACIEQGSTEWLARVLETGKEPYYFVPSGTHSAQYFSLKSVLCKAVNDTYGADKVVFVSADLFNRKAAEQATSLFMEEDFTLP